MNILPSGGLDTATRVFPKSVAETYPQSTISWSPSLLPWFYPDSTKKGKDYGLPHLSSYVSVLGQTASLLLLEFLGRLQNETHKYGNVGNLGIYEGNKVIYTNTI